MAETSIFETVRKCKKCLKEHPIEKFHKHPRGKNGRRSRCVECTTVESRILRQRDGYEKHRKAKKAHYERVKNIEEERQKRNERQRKYRAENPEVRIRNREYRRLHLKRYQATEFESQLRTKYHMSRDQFFTMLNGQDGKCAICRTVLAVETSRKAKNRKCIDHDHDTGKVRGILCSPCNSGLGYFGDSLSRVEAAADYLRKNVP